MYSYFLSLFDITLMIIANCDKNNILVGLYNTNSVIYVYILYTLIKNVYEYEENILIPSLFMHSCQKSPPPPPHKM